jgi:hypothetical protein
LVRKNRIIAKDQLVKREWQRDISYIFYGNYEDSTHLFITCGVAQVLWHWIASHNSFLFQGQSLEDFMIPW